MANTSLGLGAFASGVANGMQMGMKMDQMNNKESGADLAKKNTEENNAIISLGSRPGAPGAQATPAIGTPGQSAQAPAAAQGAQQPGAAGGSPWSFIGSLFGGSNG